MGGIEGALSANALVIFGTARAGDGMRVEMDSEMLVSKGYGSLDRKIGVAFAATGSAVVCHCCQSLGGHEVGEMPRVGRQRGVVGNNGDIHSRAYGGTASAPIATGATGDLMSALEHFEQGVVEINISSCIAIGGKERGANKDMVFGTMHVAEIHRHEGFQNLNGISRGSLLANEDNGVDARGVAFVADKMALGTTDTAIDLLVAEYAFHEAVGFEILEGATTDEAFVVVHRLGLGFGGLIITRADCQETSCYKGKCKEGWTGHFFGFMGLGFKV